MERLQTTWKDIWIVAGITAVVVGGVVYSWRESVWQQRIPPLQSEVAELRTKAEKAEELPWRNLSLPVCNGIWERQASNEKFLEVVAPNSGVSLCANQSYDIQWETSTTLRTVNLLVRKANGTAVHQLGIFPGERGKHTFTWFIGNTEEGVQFSEGSGYEVVVNAVLEGCLIADTSDSVFSIIRCP